MKESFVLYTSQYEAVADLSVQQKGELFDALFQYVSTGDEPKFTDREVKMAFNFIRIQIDRDNAKYAEVCERRRAAGRMGGRPRKQVDSSESNASDEKQKKQMVSDKSKKSKSKHNDNVNDSDNEYDNDNDGNTKLSLGDTVSIDTSSFQTEKEKKEAYAAEEEKRFMAFFQYFNRAIASSGSSIKPCKELDDDRRAALRRIFAKYKTEDIQLAVRNMVYSNFANGRTAARKKACDIDWLLKPANFKHAFEDSL